MSNEAPKPLICGGTSQIQQANPDIQALVDKISDQVKAKSEGRDYSKLTAIEYMSQLVNGQNYFVKAKSAAGQIVHLRIFQPFPHHGSTDPQLHGILHDKKHEEPIHYF